ncbi:uncharacterized protein LOC124365606 [Homalodisca vitripennis]|uniref:uncharacterized protein LOC124365606 n=1 Tax=Homalodisca vitripennis TaxID=197043 RepID=UPI001EEB521B|nr:uncharacterized protein LOC124365606 [Homalodisca vitripennis]
MGIKILQVNLQHSKAASAVLCRRFFAEEFHVALTRELWICMGKTAGLSIAVVNISYVNNARSCIVARINEHSIPVLEFCSRDLSTVRLTGAGAERTFFITLSYLPYDDVDSTPSREITLVDHVRRSGLELVIGPDANLHKEAWGNTNTSSRSKSILEYIISRNLVIVNVGNVPKSGMRTRKEVIDVTMMTGGMVDRIHG